MSLHNDEMTSNEMIAISVNCGNVIGVLYKDRMFCPGIHADCIQLEDGHFVTPKTFTVMGEKERLKDWKSAVRSNGMTIRKMMDLGQLDFTDHTNNCSGRCVARLQKEKTDEEVIKSLSSIKSEFDKDDYLSPPTLTPLMSTIPIINGGVIKDSIMTTINPNKHLKPVLTKKTPTPPPPPPSGSISVSPSGGSVLQRNKTHTVVTYNRGSISSAASMQSVFPGVPGTIMLAAPTSIPYNSRAISPNTLYNGSTNTFQAIPDIAVNYIPRKSPNNVQYHCKYSAENKREENGVSPISMEQLRRYEEEIANQDEEQIDAEEALDFWKGIIAVGVLEDFFREIKTSLDCMKNQLSRRGITGLEAKKLSTIVSQLGLMTRLKVKLSMHKNRAEKDADELQRQMDDLKRQLLETEKRQLQLKRKSDCFEHLMEISSFNKMMKKDSKCVSPNESLLSGGDDGGGGGGGSCGSLDADNSRMVIVHPQPVEDD